jgi:hypothetical protein
MANVFPVIEIQPAWVLDREALGSKRKFWYRQPEPKSDWLFKYPQPNTGQHWAEKIAAEIADCLNIPHARVELALFQDNRGSTTESFIQDGWSLSHGNQVLAGQVFGYNPEAKYGQSDHTLANIFLALEKIFAQPEDAQEAKRSLADDLVLDAVIGNTDRHHENWGILLKQEDEQWVGSVAPTFDHASSLGRELLDEGKKKSRLRLLNEKRVRDYVEQASGAIYWDKTDKRGISPLELVRRAVSLHKDIFKPALARVAQLDRTKVEAIVSRIPDDWMTPLARQFSIEIMRYNLEQLRRIL